MRASDCVAALGFTDFLEQRLEQFDFSDADGVKPDDFRIGLFGIVSQDVSSSGNSTEKLLPKASTVFSMPQGPIKNHRQKKQQDSEINQVEQPTSHGDSVLTATLPTYPDSSKKTRPH